ncbi:HSP20-like chaperone [Amanita muscaria]|uniref:SHSP domain-containing protein n=1 Tax=Amanita muscaria (strain Koide BX008) TaxID=946122 RepID=A0A0C2TL95_AMAMK|nr:hypothetical protein M378DRAFT_72738 [Amanita muscaria Koide BX008]
MAISRLLNEFRPLFQMLEEPITRAPTVYARPNRVLFDDPFRSAFGGLGTLGVHPAMDVKEEGDKYVIDADLPGVKKDNVEIRVGEDGRSISIEGKFVQESQDQSPSQAEESGETDSTAVTRSSESSNQISTERMQSIHATFQRTIWLPRPIEAQSVKAKLENGVLKVMAKKAEDKGTTVVPVE